MTILCGNKECYYHHPESSDGSGCILRTPEDISECRDYCDHSVIIYLTDEELHLAVKRAGGAVHLVDYARRRLLGVG